ncbi:MAG TPA: NAD(P)/FAD-dependent oxidoreductase [Phycisphaerae bacterium]|nr:NAD(P)/FAD-dependent oxidoreductase [Phycisphaerae bacterium]
MYDALIVGAGPAGATIAALLAREERSVLLVERQALPRKRTQTVWVSAEAAALLDTAGLDAKAMLGQPFDDVTFYSADLGKTAKPALGGPAGYLVNRSAFEHELVKAAVKAGAELRENSRVVDIGLFEHEVEARFGEGESARGRVLLAAMGYRNDLAGPLYRAGQPPAPLVWTAQVEAALKKSGQAKPAVAVVLGLDRNGAFGLVMVTPKRLAVAIGAGGGPQQVTKLFTELCQRLAAGGVVPVDLSSEAAEAKVRPSPAGIALEMDTHVAKHTLIIGEAGGFVAAASNEGIYPAMWSAQLASEVVLEALGSKHSQDVLMQFDSKWRMSMAEYLRPPNTDIQFLLPLIFSNQPMADRMGAAFFCGRNI